MNLSCLQEWPTAPQRLGRASPRGRWQWPGRPAAQVMQRVTKQVVERHTAELACYACVCRCFELACAQWSNSADAAVIPNPLARVPHACSGRGSRGGSKRAARPPPADRKPPSPRAAAGQPGIPAGTPGCRPSDCGRAADALWRAGAAQPRAAGQHPAFLQGATARPFACGNPPTLCATLHCRAAALPGSPGFSAVSTPCLGGKASCRLWVSSTNKCRCPFAPGVAGARPCSAAATGCEQLGGAAGKGAPAGAADR